MQEIAVSVREMLFLAIPPRFSFARKVSFTLSMFSGAARALHSGEPCWPF